MKIMIEVSGGSVTGITATDDCEIYLVDHDDIENRSFHPVDNAVEVMHPDCITGEIDLDDNDETPEFDKLLQDALEE